ncbi:hypothetical protein QJS10_CPB04g00220 [Acorus calamus]|uniref:Uncharacterized protein n=1 Tax=Acorus calamus TaxID=4465 RepID=A0AAV9EZV9_ACOCL|nr:hypothetical protein QJS10_CPB04g00220 [Acorus calamus]
MSIPKTIVALLTISSLHLLLHITAASNGPIKTIVVLVLENRSFDHMIGYMKKTINPSIDGLNGDECNPQSTQNPNSQSICVSDDAQYVESDPDHSFEAIKEQVFGSGEFPSMSGFVQQASSVSPNLSETVMKCFSPSSVPVYESLVSEFAVFDRWFSSIPGPTQPNRLFAYSATSHGATSHVKATLLKGYPQKTIFDSLHEEGLDFRVYYQSIPTTLFFRNMRRLRYVFKFSEFGWNFRADARKGRLPSLSVIEPRYFDVVGSPGNDDHPSHDVAEGQRLVKEVYEAMRAGPQWNQSLLIVTYDEHGGFFDHVSTPYKGVPSPDGIVGPAPEFFGFDRLGVRVPTIMASPWIKRGTVVRSPKGPTESSEFEHSSIPATVKKMFNLSSDYLTFRDRWAGTFESLFTELDSPRTDCPEVLPDVVPLRKTNAKEDAKLSQFQSELVHLATVLNGDHYLTRFTDEATKRMTVKDGHEYVSQAFSRFVQASKEATELGAHNSAIVDMRPSLTSRSRVP